MCCRLTVHPLDPEIATLVLRTGLFVPSDDLGLQWSRYVLEEGCSVNAILIPDAGALRLELTPSVSAYEHHMTKRLAGGVYFEIAARYAEKVDGKITQLSNVTGCTEGGVSEHVLAHYPALPLCWEQVCPGFREAIMGAGGNFAA